MDDAHFAHNRESPLTYSVVGLGIGDWEWGFGVIVSVVFSMVSVVVSLLSLLITVCGVRMVAFKLTSFLVRDGGGWGAPGCGALSESVNDGDIER